MRASLRSARVEVVDKKKTRFYNDVRCATKYMDNMTRLYKDKGIPINGKYINFQEFYKFSGILQIFRNFTNF